MKITGKIIVQGKLTVKQVFALEQWLNEDVATKAYEKYAIGLRFHVSKASEIDEE